MNIKTLKQILLLNLLILLNGCSSLECTVEGPFKYCAPSSTFTSKISYPKISSNYKESKTLQKQWLSAIKDVATYLRKNNTPLYGKNMTASFKQNFTQEQKGRIKIEHINKIATVTYPKKMPHFLRNEELLYIADSFSILRDLTESSKILSKHYLSSKLKVYTTNLTNSNCDNKDVCTDGYGNLYINSSLLNNSKKLKTILWHEANHLLPVGIHNESLRKQMFKAFQSKEFKVKHKKHIENNAHTGNYSVLQLISKANPSRILNSLTNEFEIDAQVLSLIRNDTQLCMAYSQSLYDAPDKSRAKIIKFTCKYMENHTFKYSPSVLLRIQEEWQLLTQNPIEYILNNMQNKNFEENILIFNKRSSTMNEKEKIKSIAFLVSIPVIEKTYKNNQTKNIMLKWYTQILSEFLSDMYTQTKFRDSFQEI